MDTAFLVVVAVNAVLLSALVAFRMQAGGASARRIAPVVGELWVALGLWVVIFRALGAELGVSGAGGAAGELRELGARLAALPAGRRTWFAATGAVALAILGHLVWSLRRATRD